VVIRADLGFNGLVEKFKKHGYAPVVISPEVAPTWEREGILYGLK
jgi:hypothetical protein